MEISKSTLYGIGIFVIIVATGYFLSQNGQDSSSSSIDNGVITATGEEVQEIVIGMKNYNYYPNTIKFKAGIPARISLDESVTGCFRSFTIKEFGIKKYLATPSDYVEFTPEKPGTYTFACSMGMGYGTLIVE